MERRRKVLQVEGPAWTRVGRDGGLWLMQNVRGLGWQQERV